MSSAEVIAELVSRRDHCAKTTTLHCAGRGGSHFFAIYVSGKIATTPVLFICDKGASLLDDVELEGPRHRKLPLVLFRVEEDDGGQP